MKNILSLNDDSTLTQLSKIKKNDVVYLDQVWPSSLDLGLGKKYIPMQSGIKFPVMWFFINSSCFECIAEGKTVNDANEKLIQKICSKPNNLNSVSDKKMNKKHFYTGKIILLVRVLGENNDPLQLSIEPYKIVDHVSVCHTNISSSIIVTFSERYLVQTNGYIEIRDVNRLVKDYSCNKLKEDEFVDYSFTNPVAGYDIVLIPNFDRILQFNANIFLDKLSHYPTRKTGDKIVWGEVQWVDGDNETLKYRGNKLLRSKIWLQQDDPMENGFIRYWYTGWQKGVLPATAGVKKCEEMVKIWKNYNKFCKDNDIMTANHCIITRYADGDHNIGAHSDKEKSIAKSNNEEKSMITVVKLGPTARPFKILDKKMKTVLWEEVVPVGTAIMMSLEDNLETAHAVPPVDFDGLSGSLVFRKIIDRWTVDKTEKEIEKAEIDKVKRDKAKKAKKEKAKKDKAKKDKAKKEKIENKKKK